jgi:hypothetical protein
MLWRSSDRVGTLLRSLVADLPAALRAIVRWFCLAIRREANLGADQCNTLNSPVVLVPDPLIYDQYYLMGLGLPVTWDNPDIFIFRGGVPVAPSDLEADTTYQVVARVWNNSTAAPVAGLPVAFSYLSFGIGTVSHPIGQTAVNLGVKGGPDQPAFAFMSWTTPAVAGHYCIQANLKPASDANWNNNLGQENTHVAAAQSPAIASFALRNDTDRRQRYEFRADAYGLVALAPCPPGDGTTGIATGASLRARLAALSGQPSGQPVPLPAGWQVTLDPASPELAPDEEIAVQATVEPPIGFTGTQAVNIHAFRTQAGWATAPAILAGGLTVNVSST